MLPCLCRDFNWYVRTSHFWYLQDTYVIYRPVFQKSKICTDWIAKNFNYRVFETWCCDTYITYTADTDNLWLISFLFYSSRPEWARLQWALNVHNQTQLPSLMTTTSGTRMATTQATGKLYQVPFLHCSDAMPVTLSLLKRRQLEDHILAFHSSGNPHTEAENLNQM